MTTTARPFLVTKLSAQSRRVLDRIVLDLRVRDITTLTRTVHAAIADAAPLDKAGRLEALQAAGIVSATASHVGLTTRVLLDEVAALRSA